VVCTPSITGSVQPAANSTRSWLRTARRAASFAEEQAAPRGILNPQHAIHYKELEVSAGERK